MQKWEYKVINADEGFDYGGKIGRYEIEKINEGLNELGKDGWELVSVRYDEDGMIHRAIFKRGATQEEKDQRKADKQYEDLKPSGAADWVKNQKP